MSAISGDKGRASDLFDGFGLSDGLLRGIRSDGPERPSKDQQRALSAMLDGRNTVGQMQSGTGWMATCLIGALQRIEYEKKECQVLVLVPTRELAQQTCQAAGRLGANLGLRSLACVGRNDWRTRDASLRDGQHLVVGTPTIVMDAQGSNNWSKGHLRVAHVSCLVLYDADDMFCRGFADAVYEIITKMPPEVQVCLFAAALPDEILGLMDRFVQDPARICVEVPVHCELIPFLAALPQEILGVMESLLLYPVRPLRSKH